MMCIPSPCLCILAALIGITDALKRKSLNGSLTSGGWSADENDPDDATHRASGVARGDCTKRLVPTLLFVGEAYSGSTSLSGQMALHQELSFGDTKEHQYFDTAVSGSNVEQYFEQFWVGCSTTVTFDASMGYLKMVLGHEFKDPVKGVEKAVFVRNTLGPNLKLMLMIRDPVDILFHKECHDEGMNLRDRPFTVDDPPNISEQNDRVSRALEQWLHVYTRDHWLFLSSDDYFASPQNVLDKIFAFTGVAPMKLNKSAIEEQSGRRRCALKATPEERRAYWSVKDNMDYKRKLEQMTGLTFHWSD